MTLLFWSLTTYSTKSPGWICCTFCFPSISCRWQVDLLSLLQRVQDTLTHVYSHAYCHAMSGTLVLLFCHSELPSMHPWPTTLHMHKGIWARETVTLPYTTLHSTPADKHWNLPYSCSRYTLPVWDWTPPACGPIWESHIFELHWPWESVEGSKCSCWNSIIGWCVVSKCEKLLGEEIWECKQIVFICSSSCPFKVFHICYLSMITTSVSCLFHIHLEKQRYNLPFFLLCTFCASSERPKDDFLYFFITTD